MTEIKKDYNKAIKIIYFYIDILKWLPPSSVCETSLNKSFCQGFFPSKFVLLYSVGEMYGF